ncbi:BrnT family toxin [Rhizobium panacihumi]|uniref:BrnT family toxin n=1 Tax=Rhizobium panacihumi TaxID=2008450 RepID=UPI003D7AD46D
MIFVWDEVKRRANQDKHGLDFADVVWFGWETAVLEPSHSGRVKAIGYYRDGTAVVIYATLGTEAISIISFRDASPKERNRLP